jgi:hypothetical protein
MAGPKPFQSAVTPSFAISLLAQSMKPLYVPCGADWSRDLIVWKRRQRGSKAVECLSVRGVCVGITPLTSGGMARAHIATPAVPPAAITAGSDNGGAGAGSPLGRVPGLPESSRLRIS